MREKRGEKFDNSFKISILRVIGGGGESGRGGENFLEGGDKAGGISKTSVKA